MDIRTLEETLLYGLLLLLHGLQLPFLRIQARDDAERVGSLVHRGDLGACERHDALDVHATEHTGRGVHEEIREEVEVVLDVLAAVTDLHAARAEELARGVHEEEIALEDGFLDLDDLCSAGGVFGTGGDLIHHFLQFEHGGGESIDIRVVFRQRLCDGADITDVLRESVHRGLHEHIHGLLIAHI